MDIVIVTPIQLFGDALASYLGGRPGIAVLAIAESFSLLRDCFHRSHVDLGDSLIPFTTIHHPIRACPR